MTEIKHESQLLLEVGEMKGMLRSLQIMQDGSAALRAGEMHVDPC
jgi:hypothetical protein